MLEKRGWNLLGWIFLTKPSTRQGGAGLNTLEARTEQKGVSQQKVLERGRAYWECRRTGRNVLERSQVARRAEGISGRWIKAGQATSLQQRIPGFLRDLTPKLVSATEELGVL